MPDPDLLPGGRRMPVAAPPRLDGILAGARRRRRLQVAAATAMTSGVAVALVLVFLPGGSTSSLKVVTPAVGTSPTPAPSVTASTAHVPGSAGGAPLVRRSGVATSGPGPSAGA